MYAHIASPSIQTHANNRLTVPSHVKLGNLHTTEKEFVAATHDIFDDNTTPPSGVGRRPAAGEGGHIHPSILARQLRLHSGKASYRVDRM